MDIRRYGTQAMVVLAVGVLSACGRDRADTAQTAPSQQPGVQLERSAEKAAADAGRALEKAGAVLDDASVTAKVKTALIAEPGLSGMAIDVDTSQNVVTLNGTVASDDLRQRAERVARGIEGVKEVKNNLTVKAS
jgi:hyperosmotically inducible protein